MSTEWFTCEDCNGRFRSSSITAVPRAETEDDPWAGGVEWVCRTCIKAREMFGIPT